jgi:hypothetical protein
MSKIINFYETMSPEFQDPIMANPNKSNHGFDIPFRSCVIAPSGSGKTTFVANLIQRFCAGEGTFAYITIICQDAEEPIYKMLRSKSDRIIIKEGLENLPSLAKADKKISTLTIIDDCQLKKDQERAMEYYIRGRKVNCSVIYLAQNYYKVPLIIRNNCTYCIILRMDACAREVNMILKEKAGTCSKEQLLGMYNYATQNKFDSFIISCEERDIDRKYRRNFLEYIKPSDYGVANSST